MTSDHEILAIILPFAPYNERLRRKRRRKLTKPNSTHEMMVAPCGLDCRLCRAYTRERRACPGCRGGDRWKSNASITCKIKNCETRKRDGIEFCVSCDECPCALVRHLDKRYRTNYGVSPIENLVNIGKLGISQFVISENERWICTECGEVLCVHKAQCPSCGHVWRE